METVKIVCKENKRLGWKIINKDDLTKDDVLFDDSEKPKKKREKKDNGIV